MAKKAQKLDRFDAALVGSREENPWQPGGTYAPDYELLKTLLGIAAGEIQQTGMVAAATDLWAASELRRAGFDEDEVWPRTSQPRVLPRDVKNFVNTLPKKLRVEMQDRYTRTSSRRALPAEAHVLGSAYSKQADVVVASWIAGVELLISTKTMLSSYQKNLRNRFEEAYGDAKNLRGRHPLAALGFIFVVGADIPESSFEFAVDMLRKLVRESDVYDCASLLVIEGAEGAPDDPAEDQRAPDEEPVGLVGLANPVADDSEDEASVDTPALASDLRDVTLDLDRVPTVLSPEVFFQHLIGAALDRMPIKAYQEVRRRIAIAGDGLHPGG